MELVKSIIGESVDSLVLQGIDYVEENGEMINARAGDGLQSYNVDYILTNPLNRVHNLRAPKSVEYLSRELLAYFKGTLDVEDMIKVGRYWGTIADENGKINSNYGYNVFHQKVPNEKSQYEWVVNLLQENLKSRRGIININQISHKTDTKDMPCTVAMQFYVKNNYLNNIVSSRSTDIITGLPYDQGFFSFVLELMHVDLVNRGHTDLKLGYCTMRSIFTQLYSSRTSLKEEVLTKRNSQINEIFMPKIREAKSILDDIKNNTNKSELLQWCEKMAKKS